MRRARNPIAACWFDLARSSMELMQGSAEVIARRGTAMALAGTSPSAAHDREMRRMVEEKASASAESLTCMAFGTAAAYQSMFLSAVLGGRAPTPRQWQQVTTGILQSGMAPYRKTVRENVRRLRK